MARSRWMYLALLLLAACGKGAGAVADAGPGATTVNDREIAELLARIAPCDASDPGKCAPAAELKTLASARNKDPAKQLPTWNALLDCIDSGNSAQRYACVMAANFEVYPAGRYDDTAAARRVLTAAKSEPARYTSSRLGEFLAGFQESDKTGALHADLVAFLQDRAAPPPARIELVRLSSEAGSLKRASQVDALYALLTDEKTPFELRSQILSIAYRIKDPTQRARFEGWLLGHTSDADGKMARQIVETLGSLGGPQSLTAALATWKAQSGGAEKKEWASSVAAAMRSFLERNDAGIDRKRAYDTAATIARDASIPGFWRSNAVYALQFSGETRAKADLQALAKDRDASVAQAATRAVSTLEKRDSTASTASVGKTPKKAMPPAKR